MITEDKLKDIILTMIENKMLDNTRIFDKEYVLERVNLYIESANFNKKYLFKIEKNIIFANRKINKLAIHLPPKGRSLLATD